LRAIAGAVRAAYNRPLGAKISRQAFQTAFALSGWASLNAAQSPLGPNRSRALAVMQLIAATDDLFADPQGSGLGPLAGQAIGANFKSL